MTFCLAIKVSDGLVGIADTRVISGSENITARKVAVFEQDGGSFVFFDDPDGNSWAVQEIKARATGGEWKK